MIPVKICGITSLSDAMLVAELGGSAIGFIFYDKSPRFVSLNKAREISKALQSTIPTIGVFVNPELDTVNNISEFVGLDFIQLHGEESPEFCNLISLPVIKAFRIDNTISSRNLEDYPVYALLFDTYKPNVLGGTGDTFDWSIAKQLKTKLPTILSGGLNSSNLLQGISATQPEAVDINSGVESRPGKKYASKLRNAFKILKKTGDYPNIFDISSLLH